MQRFSKLFQAERWMTGLPDAPLTSLALRLRPPTPAELPGLSGAGHPFAHSPTSTGQGGRARQTGRSGVGRPRAP